MFEGWLTSGRFADVVLAVLAVEAALLVLWRRMRGRGPFFADMAGNLASGVFMVLALRAALTSAGALAIAACLSLSFLAHAYDLSRRGPW